MKGLFDQAFDFTIGNETSQYTNNPNDSGGPTKWGITLRSYTSFVGHIVFPIDIENLTEDKAKTFYFNRYWTPLLCEQMTHPEIAIAIFDTSVLYGVGTAALLAQEALSSIGVPLKLDGFLGDKSIGALNAALPGAFIQSFQKMILDRIHQVITLNPKNESFRAGWQNRASRLLTLTGCTPSNREVT